MDVLCRDVFRSGLLYACLVIAVSCANLVRGQTSRASDQNSPQIPNEIIKEEVPPKEPFWFEHAKTCLADSSDRFFEGLKDTFLRTDNMVALLLAGGASVAMHNERTDEHIASHLRRHRGLSNFWDETFNITGSPATHFSAAALWYVISAENQDELNRQRAITMFSALSVTGTMTMGLKAARHNDTPNGDNWSWPSAHTSSSFTVASVLHEFYGLKVGIPAYALASLVAYRMMDAGDHWASDIVFGATLGWVVGHTMAGKHKELEIAGFQLMPYFGNINEPAIGISLVKRF